MRDLTMSEILVVSGGGLDDPYWDNTENPLQPFGSGGIGDLGKNPQTTNRQAVAICDQGNLPNSSNVTFLANSGSSSNTTTIGASGGIPGGVVTVKADTGMTATSNSGYTATVNCGDARSQPDFSGAETGAFGNQKMR